MSAAEPTSHDWSFHGQQARVRFDVVADHTPGLLPRLLAPFARRDLAPDDLHAATAGAGLMRVRIALERAPADQVQGVEGNLRQVVGVRSVLVQREVTGVLRRGRD